MLSLSKLKLWWQSSLWQEDKRSRVLLSVVFLPKDPALISHSACYVFSPKGVHRASFNSFSNLTVNVSRRLISRRQPRCYLGKYCARGVGDPKCSWRFWKYSEHQRKEGEGNWAGCWKCIYILALPPNALWPWISHIISPERSSLFCKVEGDGLCHQESFQPEQPPPPSPLLSGNEAGRSHKGTNLSHSLQLCH